MMRSPVTPWRRQQCHCRGRGPRCGAWFADAACTGGRSTSDRRWGGEWAGAYRLPRARDQRSRTVVGWRRLGGSTWPPAHASTAGSSPTLPYGDSSART